MCQESIDMQFRDVISLSFHHTVLRISPSGTILRVPGRKLPGKARIWYCRTLQFLSHFFSSSAIFPVSICFDQQGDDATFFGFSKSADDGSPRAGGPSKTCPEAPNEFRVSSSKQESQLIIPLGLGILLG